MLTRARWILTFYQETYIAKLNVLLLDRNQGPPKCFTQCMTSVSVYYYTSAFAMFTLSVLWMFLVVLITNSVIAFIWAITKLSKPKSICLYTCALNTYSVVCTNVMTRHACLVGNKCLITKSVSSARVFRSAAEQICYLPVLKAIRCSLALTNSSVEGGMMTDNFSQLQTLKHCIWVFCICWGIFAST